MVQGVEFDEEKAFSTPVNVPQKPSVIERRYSPTGNEPKMIQWLIRHGYARSPLVGQFILLAVVVINALIAYFVITTFVK